MDELTDTVEKVEVPDKDNLIELERFYKSLQEIHGDARGVKTLGKRIHNYIHHSKLCVSGWEQIVTSINFFNGERTPRGTTPPNVIARRFYNTLSTPGLRMQCVAFGIEFEDYDTIDDVINELVEKHVAVMSNGS